ncbi:protein preli-like [Brevipalpus obovatus]|uniref:protein preli-like n=1 Tax=Brevipalpus obovatus TaxID=246614 RepID=UPI003D9E2373
MEKYSYSWNQVAIAHWHRYPNPFNDNIVSEDTIERYIDKDGKLVTKRLLGKKGSVPKWASKLFGSGLCFVVEESIVDPVNKIFITRAKNVELQSIVSIVEEVTYRQSMDNKVLTIAERKASVEPKIPVTFVSVQSIVEKYFQEGWNKASRGFEAILRSKYPS